MRKWIWRIAGGSIFIPPTAALLIGGQMYTAPCWATKKRNIGSKSITGCACDTPGFGVFREKRTEKVPDFIKKLLTCVVGWVIIC